MGVIGGAVALAVLIPKRMDEKREAEYHEQMAPIRAELERRSIARQEAEEQAERERQAILEIFNEVDHSTIGDFTYELRDQWTVATETSLARWVFDFKGDIVFVDGPENTDRIILFREFQDASAIEQARRAGLEIARNITNKNEDLTQAQRDVLEDNTFYRTTMAKALNFLTLAAD